MSHTTSLTNHLDYRICRGMEAGIASGRTSHGAFVGMSALVFVTSVALTIVWCASMSAMRGMPMPGGWTMSMAWMRMPGQTWAGAAVSFVGMWLAMMAAMMLPSFAPVLWRYRQCLARTCETRPGRLTTVVALGYLFVWTLLGLAVFPAGVAAADVEMKSAVLARAVPVAGGFVVLLAGALQFTKWKAHYLTCCRAALGRGRTVPADARAAWRQGTNFGLHCGLCCANLTAVLLVIGVMDLRAMAAVTVAITAERLAPAGQHVTRAIGAVVIGLGFFLVVRAVELG